MLKGRIDTKGDLMRAVGDRNIAQHCILGGGAHNCTIHCPHCDDSEQGIIRLSCGGTDVCFLTDDERIVFYN